MKYVHCLFFFGHCLLFHCMEKCKAKVPDDLWACNPPDRPANGDYYEKRGEMDFREGVEVTYFCKKGYILVGKDKSKCGENGGWTNPTPFCDPMIKLKIQSVQYNEKTKTADRYAIKDGNTSSCFDWMGTKGYEMDLNLEKEIIVRTVRLFLTPGSVSIQILTRSRIGYMVCNDYMAVLATNIWTTIKCREDFVADGLKIVVTHNITSSICEVEVYGKEEDECDRPPQTMLWNGYLDEVSRSRAVVVCRKGYRSKDEGPILCKEKSWESYALGCDAVLCDAALLPQIPNSRWNLIVNLTKVISVGTKYNLTCEDGYRKTRESDTVTCQPNGNWTKTKAACVEILCDAALLCEPPGGRWDPIGKIMKISPGTKRKLVCMEGYRKTNGLDMATCHQNGSWIKPTATCVKEIKHFTSNSANSMNVHSIIFIAVGIVIRVLILSLY